MNTAASRSWSLPLSLCALLLVAIPIVAMPHAARAQATAEDAATYFIAAPGEGLQGQGDWWVQAFTVYRTTKFTFRFTSDAAAQAAIIAPDQLDAFQSYDSFTGWGLFDDQFGTKFVTLNPGDYYVAVRNLVDGFNSFSLELDNPLTLANSLTATYTFNDYYVQGSSYVDPDGGIYYQPFAVQAGLRYFLDGCNSGVDTLIIPAVDLQSYLDGGNFRYYAAFSGTTPDQPGLVEVKLPPGNYDLVFENQDSVDHAMTYTMERWRATPTTYASTGLRLYGPAAWQIVDANRVRLTVQRVANNHKTRPSGSLKLELWALTAPYSGGTAYGAKMADYALPKPLAPGKYYQNVAPTVPLTPPSSGRRYLALFLTEWNGSQYVIRDFLNFSGVQSFSVASAQTARSLKGKLVTKRQTASTKELSTRDLSTRELSTAMATAATGIVSLQFATALAPVTAAAAAHYTVAVNGRTVAVASASYHAAAHTVLLTLPEGALHGGDRVSVQWSGLRDNLGQAVAGQANLPAQ